MLREDLKLAVERCSSEQKWTYSIGKVSRKNFRKCSKTNKDDIVGDHGTVIFT